MAGRQKKPVAVLKATGRSHYSKEELAQREATEVKPTITNLEPPAYLTRSQKANFRKIRGQLEALGIMGDTDVEALARYVIENESYLLFVEMMNKCDLSTFDGRSEYMALANQKDKAFKSVRAAASDLGLTISSRCKLIVPQPKTEEKPVNKFSQFIAQPRGGGDG